MPDREEEHGNWLKYRRYVVAALKRSHEADQAQRQNLDDHEKEDERRFDELLDRLHKIDLGLAHMKGKLVGAVGVVVLLVEIAFRIVEHWSK